MTLANKASFILICALMIFTTLIYGAVHQPVVAIFYIAIAVLLILWAVDALRSGAVRASRSLLQIPFFAAALFGLFQVIPFGSLAGTAGVSGIPRTISHDPFWTQVAALHFIALGILFSCTLVVLDSAKRLSRLATVMLIFGFGYAFFAILQSVLSPDKIYGIYDALAPFGSFVNRHNFAAVMEMFIAIPIGMLFAGAVARDKRLLYVTAIALMGAALLLSGSRGGLAAFVSAVILMAILTAGGEGKRKVAIRLALSAALIAAIFAGALFVGGDTSLTRVAETAATKDVTTGRFDIWAVTLKMIAANMPFGSGLGAYGVAYTRFDDASGLERVEQAHNDFLQVASDAGIVGIAIGVFFLFVLFREGRAAVRTGNLYRRGIALGAIAGIFSVIVHSLFDFVLHTTAVAVVFVILLAMLVTSKFDYADDVPDEEGRLHHRKKHRSHKPVAPFRR
jgi:O-antigen ligase